jgi:hypothetical protein
VLPEISSEQAVLSAVESAQHVVVDGHTDATIVGKHPRLWLDQLRGEDAVNGAEQCVAAHQVQIPAELFDTSCSQSTLTTIYEYIRLHTSPLACTSTELVPAATPRPSPGQENPAGGVRNSNWGGVHARDYKELRRSSRQAAQPAHAGPDADRNIAVSVPLPGISLGGSYVHPALGMELDLDSRRRGLRFSGSTHAASRDEPAKITRTVSRSAWISTKASFENNGESHMKAMP